MDRERRDEEGVSDDREVVRDREAPTQIFLMVWYGLGFPTANSNLPLTAVFVPFFLPPLLGRKNNTIG